MIARDDRRVLAVELDRGRERLLVRGARGDQVTAIAGDDALGLEQLELEVRVGAGALCGGTPKLHPNLCLAILREAFAHRERGVQR